MNPFVSRITGNNWVWPVSALSAVLGFMMMLAWITKDTYSTRVPLLAPDQRSRIPENAEYRKVVQEYQKAATEVATLRADKTKLENAIASQTSSTKVLNESLQEVKMFAGLTEVEGPGVTVTLRDSTKPVEPGFSNLNANIHDYDVFRVVNELWASGAEAIAVNKHRLVGRSSIRCAGPVIHVDGIPISTPVVIQAIGEAETLASGVNLKGGVLDEIRASDPNMVQVTTFMKARLPAYAGSTAFKLTSVPEAKK